MDITLRLAWRNLWRQPRRTWLTVGAMVFSNIILVFLISLQLGMYQMMIENSLRAQTGHLQVQAPGYKDENKIRQVVPDVSLLAERLRDELATDEVAARAAGFALISSADRSYGAVIGGVEPLFEETVSSLPGLVKDGRYLEGLTSEEIVVGSVTDPEIVNRSNFAGNIVNHLRVNAKTLITHQSLAAELNQDSFVLRSWHNIITAE